MAGRGGSLCRPSPRTEGPGIDDPPRPGRHTHPASTSGLSAPLATRRHRQRRRSRRPPAHAGEARRACREVQLRVNVGRCAVGGPAVTQQNEHRGKPRNCRLGDQRLGPELAHTEVGGGEGGAGSPPSSALRPARRKNQLRVGAARWLCSGHRPERSAWLGSYDRVVLTSARCANLPAPARESGHTGSRRAPGDRAQAPVAGSDDAEARWAAGRRCRGFAGSCGWSRSLDRDRSDPCCRHQQGSCGPFCARSGRDARLVD
jgi:hypothetical protein